MRALITIAVRATASQGERYAVVCQAMGFALMHVQGVPGGATGVLLTGAFGLAAGAVTVRSGRVGAAIVAHTIADTVILVSILAS